MFLDFQLRVLLLGTLFNLIFCRYTEVIAIKEAQEISAQEEVAQASSALSGRVVSQELGPIPGIWAQDLIVGHQDDELAIEGGEFEASMEVMHDEEALAAALEAVESDYHWRENNSTLHTVPIK